MSVVPGVPVIDVDPYDPATLRDPYPMHRRLRDAGPVGYIPRYGHYALARFAQVRAALADAETYSSAAGVGLRDPREPGYFRTPGLLLEQDPPEHTRFRGVFGPLLSAPAVRALRERSGEVAARLVDRLVARRHIDVVADLARPFPLTVLPDAVGLPVEGREHLIPFGDLVFNGFGPENELFRAALERSGPARGWVAEAMRRENLSATGMGATIFGFADEGIVTEHEAGLLVRNFLSAGIDTTVSAISGALYLLARHPDQWRALRADPSRARAAFEESVRLISPVQAFARRATRDVRFGDVTVPAGSRFLLFHSAANRDPRRWADPDRFDVDRRAAGHVGFGHGIHACVGQVIARLEGELVLTALARRVERIEPLGEPRWHLNNAVRSIASLPVRLHPAA
jgi:4-methoxybenzoate monooxygenase (O-demethylating)